MPLTRARKEELTQEYERDLAKVTHAFVIGYQGVTVPQVTELRQRIRQKGGKYIVVKNTLALRAIRGGALEALSQHFSGATAIAYSADDPVALAKVLTDFVKEVPAVQFRGAVVDGTPVQAGQIQEIAALPTRQQLITKLVFLLQSPVSRFVRVLAAAPQQFVGVLDQVRAKKESA